MRWRTCLWHVCIGKLSWSVTCVNIYLMQLVKGFINNFTIVNFTWVHLNFTKKVLLILDKQPSHVLFTVDSLQKPSDDLWQQLSWVTYRNSNLDFVLTCTIVFFTLPSIFMNITRRNCNLDKGHERFTSSIDERTLLLLINLKVLFLRINICFYCTFICSGFIPTNSQTLLEY